MNQTLWHLFQLCFSSALPLHSRHAEWFFTRGATGNSDSPQQQPPQPPAEDQAAQPATAIVTTKTTTPSAGKRYGKQSTF